MCSEWRKLRSCRHITTCVDYRRLLLESNSLDHRVSEVVVRDRPIWPEAGELVLNVLLRRPLDQYGISNYCVLPCEPFQLNVGYRDILEVDIDESHISQLHVAKLGIPELAVDEVHVLESAVDECWSSRCVAARVVDVAQCVSIAV